ncbi:TetR/AcrR family transcriptional regulator [Actinosynnema sp. NPDC020468]|uniref:TetR/AcrR family transcriptional regulator n=1 Tax=Actinosynnema sp. NPDC020468 TaxID=3154488 RepID=UPI00340B6190
MSGHSSRGGDGLRADARRNREQIIAAARDLFVDKGLNVPMEDLARSANVGVGTLYRRFPDREALLHAVVADIVHSLLRVGHEAREQEPEAWGALCRFMRKCNEQRLGVLLSLMGPRIREAVSKDPELMSTSTAYIHLIEDMVEAAQREGTLRADVGAGDIGIVISLLVMRVPGMPDHLRELVPGRLLEIMLDGLSTRSPNTPLAGGPLTTADLGAARPK